MIVHILKNKHKVAEDINSLNLLVIIKIQSIAVHSARELCWQMKCYKW